MGYLKYIIFILSLVANIFLFEKTLSLSFKIRELTKELQNKNNIEHNYELQPNIQKENIDIKEKGVLTGRSIFYKKRSIDEEKREDKKIGRKKEQGSNEIKEDVEKRETVGTNNKQE